MTTGALIYLVSACGSGEEFVAAFRRYADRNGLFIPIAEPIAAGRRGRFAVALKSAGVMIEGEADVVSSSRTPSVLYGRIGMTLRFTELDEQSRTVLEELGKARLAMKPPAPSVPPRPAQIPAEPRAVPPALRGRIDAANSLAECVAIGDTASLEVVDKAAAPSKSGPKFVVPTIPPVAGGRRPAAPSPFEGMPQVAEVLGEAAKSASDEAAKPELMPPQQTLAHVAPPPPKPPPPLPPVDDEVSDPRAALPKLSDTAPQGVPAIVERGESGSIDERATEQLAAVPDPDAKPAPRRTGPRAAATPRSTPPPLPAVRASGITQVPAPPVVAQEPEQLAVFDVEISGEPTDLMMIPTPPEAADADAVAAPPPPRAPVVEEATPSGDWTITPNGPAQSGAPAGGAPKLTPLGIPTGDWTITVDPHADDGWSEPAKVAEPEPEPPPPPPPVATPLPVAIARAAKTDNDGRPRMATGSLVAIKPAAAAQAERHLDVMGIVEPKVQIDPTLIEPLPMLEPPPESIGSIGSQPDIEPMAASSSSNMRLEQALMPAYTPPPGHGYEAAPSSSPYLNAPSSGVGYAPEPAVAFAQGDNMFAPPARDPRKRRLVVILISAALVLAVGAVVLAGLSLGDDSQPSAATGSNDSSAQPPSAKPALDGSAAPAAGSGSDVKPFAMEQAPPPARAEPKECELDVKSSPAGAEVLTDASTVIATTPATVTLPCGVEVALTFRKTRFYTVEQRVTPVAGAKPLSVRLGRQTVSVKISSQPNGATVTLGGKSLGITPTTVRLPAYQESTLMIEKDGYAAETQRISPKHNSSLSLSVTLTKNPRRR